MSTVRRNTLSPSSGPKNKPTSRVNKRFVTITSHQIITGEMTWRLFNHIDSKYMIKLHCAFNSGLFCRMHCVIPLWRQSLLEGRRLLTMSSKFFDFNVKGRFITRFKGSILWSMHPIFNSLYVYSRILMNREESKGNHCHDILLISCFLSVCLKNVTLFHSSVYCRSEMGSEGPHVGDSITVTYLAVAFAPFAPKTFFFLFYNLNQQSEFTFYKLMLWLLQYLDEESFSGTSDQVNWPVPLKSSVFFSSFEERVFLGFESSVMFVAFLVDDILYVWYA
jgi:hypothetical protein